MTSPLLSEAASYSSTPCETDYGEYILGRNGRIVKHDSLPELVFNTLAIPDLFERDSQTFQHFYSSGIAGDISKKCLLQTMKVKHRLIGIVNYPRRDSVIMV